MVEINENVGVAFALVFLSGAATAIGGSVVFFPVLAKWASRKTLASALGLSAGVMTYVSFVQIMHSSESSFMAEGFPQNTARTYAGCCFFGGVILMVLLNWFVTFLLFGHHRHSHNHNCRSEGNGPNAESNKRSSKNDDDSSSSSSLSEIPPCPCHDDHPVETLNRVRHMAESMADHPDRAHPHEHHAHHSPDTKNRMDAAVPVVHIVERQTATEEDNTSVGPYSAQMVAAEDLEKASNSGKKEDPLTAIEIDSDPQEETEDHDSIEEADNNKLMRMSLNTVLAIFLHNFPEGLATFVATLSDPKVGAVLAVAIAIHNIPEGLCVAMPIYYATGSRWKAFGWAVLSGMSEPFAGLLGWIVLAQSFSHTLFAILFGIVAGMMVIISVRELLPTAHRYDPEDSVVTIAFIIGMALMAISIMLFLI